VAKYLLILNHLMINVKSSTFAFSTETYAFHVLFHFAFHPQN